MLPSWVILVKIKKMYYLNMQNTITPNNTFFAMFTHDLKSPINAEIFALEMLLKDKKNKFNQYQKEVLNDILSTSKYLKQLTENALCKFQADSGNLTLKKEFCSIKDLVKNSINHSKYLLDEKKQKLKFNCSKQEILAEVDSIELSRVLNNLISNACKYSSTNSKINITLKQSKDKIYFKIQDYGCGIKLDELEKAFEKYVRLANEQKSAGTGLGLYITKLIIDAHNGDINIDSKENKGTTIIFEIPQYSN